MSERCPRCTSPEPHLHPAMQFEGEVQPCLHPWHESTERGREAMARLPAELRRAPSDPVGGGERNGE